MAERRVVVVGGGVIGVCCAYFLAKEGAGVILVELGDEIGGGASFGSAGTIAAGHPPLNKPGRIRRSVLELLNPKSPLYIPLRWDPGLFRWLPYCGGTRALWKLISPSNTCRVCCKHGGHSAGSAPTTTFR